MARLVRDARKVEEPHEMVGDDEDAGRDERSRGEGDDRPCVRKVLQVYDVADDGERDFVRGETVRECEQEVYTQYGLVGELACAGT